MDDKQKAAPPAAATAKPALTQERKTLEAWAAQKNIGAFKPGTENHACHLAGLRLITLQRFNAIEGVEMTSEQFDAVCAELLGHPIGYQLHGVAPRKAK